MASNHGLIKLESQYLLFLTKIWTRKLCTLYLRTAGDVASSVS